MIFLLLLPSKFLCTEMRLADNGKKRFESVPLKLYIRLLFLSVYNLSFVCLFLTSSPLAFSSTIQSNFSFYIKKTLVPQF